MKKYFVLFILISFSLTLALTPDEIKEAYHKSYNYEKIQDYTNAVRVLQSVLDEYPDGYTVNLRMGWLYYLAGKYANSIEHYKKAMSKNKYSLEAKNGYLLPLIAQNKYSEAESIAYQAISTDYYNYYANLRLAYVLRMEKKYDLAVQINNKMLTVYPTDVKFLSELALNKHAQNDIKEAAEFFWNVLVLDPENTTAKKYLKVDNN